MRVLVACEFSGVVRRAFRERGHDAWSNDIIESEDNSKFHILGDALDVMMYTEGGDFRNKKSHWDMMICHPPCTHLAVSGARWFKDKQNEQKDALEFIQRLMDASIERIALENPISIISTKIRKPDQIIQPWQFGHGETKATCLWLKNLPKLVPTNIVDGRENKVHNMAPRPNRAKERGRTYVGIGKAMAEQWGSV